jgi:hypothetical protein
MGQAALGPLDLRQPAGGPGRHRRHRRPGRLGLTTDDQPNPAAATQLAAAGASVGQFGLVALAITGEFATGSIRTTLAATPARWAVVTAKAAVVGAVTFPTGLAAIALATLTASTILGIGTDGILAVSARSAAALTLTSLLMVGLGAVLRSAAGTITTAVAVLFAPPILGALGSNGRRRRHGLPPRRVDHSAGRRHRRALQLRGGGSAARRLGGRRPGRRDH